jgi:hypothetical protein
MIIPGREKDVSDIPARLLLHGFSEPWGLIMEIILITVGVWFFFAVASAFLARLKNLNGRFWFTRGLILGGFAFIYLLMVADE